jgi:hypothetical protein
MTAGAALTRRIIILVLALLTPVPALMGVTAARAAAPAIQANIVGQIVSISPPTAAAAVTVTHAGRSAAARPFQPLYPGDVVKVGRAGVTAKVVFAGGPGAGTSLTSANAPFVAPASKAGGANPSLFAAFLANWRGVLSPAGGASVVTTTPRSIEYHPSPWLPEGPQTLRAGEAQALLVVWRGSRGAVTLVSADGKPIAQVRSSTPGSAVLACPPLAPGTYELRAGSLRFPVRAAPGRRPGGTPLAQAMAAADALNGQPEGRLQALADLQALSDKVYIARALSDRLAGQRHN